MMTVLYNFNQNFEEAMNNTHCTAFDYSHEVTLSYNIFDVTDKTTCDDKKHSFTLLNNNIETYSKVISDMQLPVKWVE